MDTLTSPPVSDVLDRLFAEAEAADAPLQAHWAEALDGTADEIAKLLAEEARDYKRVYREYAENYLNISAEFGRFLYVCTRACRAKVAVEFGTSFGVSTIHLAAAIRDGGGGRLISTELEGTKAQRAQRNVAAAGLADIVDIRVGDALDTLRDGIEGTVDLVLLDGAFSLYLPVLRLVEPHLSAGAVVIAENAVDASGEYLAHVRNPDNGYRSIPLPFDPIRGNELSVRTR
ncbi:class I SAM-dependent methyltransferase [Mycobacterium sp. 236(2023)]|uniref:O-methyltransferase n=1 Tax=Mycobacterium sp. 236(2023) TaxID=3038163 RepID=UPI002415270B|nr:class I SAM-dependent methyltransferase [Mycobacterium sp. 236(2023)]MDG4667149.1 class I SAM-dependent methyltransferase [Mycobacterium sp. 236(2023)]